MLRAAANLAPRVIYVCGNTTTAAGLTVSTIREGNGTGGGFGLEAGALVLADQVIGRNSLLYILDTHYLFFPMCTNHGCG